MDTVTLPQLACIGLVHGDIVSLDQAPKNYDISEHTGTLEIDPRYQEALDGIQAGMTIVVLFWLHRASRDVLKVYPRGDRSRGLSGVFATRSPVRPNPIALSELTVLAVEGNRLQVRGLDVLDGTPIIDIKKRSVQPELAPSFRSKTDATGRTVAVINGNKRSNPGA